MVHLSAVAMRKLREWAARRHAIEASFKVGASARIAELCAAPGLSETIDACWSFRQGPEGFPLIRLRARGALHLECQRCLALLVWPIELDCRLTVVGSENEIREIASPCDTVVAGPDGLMLGTILEDEILISLPMAPVHSQCEVVRGPRPSAAPGFSRPLAGLGALMRQSRD